jgi:hypothetical protein
MPGWELQLQPAPKRHVFRTRRGTKVNSLTRNLCAAIFLVGASLGSPPADAACEDGHWIDEVLNDGAIIELEDGSIWLVDDIDRIYTAIWLPVSNIVVCDGLLINTDDGEKAHAHRVR